MVKFDNLLRKIVHFCTICCDQPTIGNKLSRTVLMLLTQKIQKKFQIANQAQVSSFCSSIAEQFHCLAVKH